jgi:hypothetical protein
VDYGYSDLTSCLPYVRHTCPEFQCDSFAKARRFLMQITCGMANPVEKQTQSPFGIVVSNCDRSCLSAFEAAQSDAVGVYIAADPT